MKPEIESVSGTDVTINWKRPANDGGSDIIGYLVEKKEKKGARWIRATKAKTVTDLTLEIQGLAEEVEYEFRVTAENQAGLGEPSEPSVPVMTKGVCGKLFLK